MGIEHCRFCHEEHDIYVSCRGVPVVQEIFPEAIDWKARAAVWKQLAKHLYRYELKKYDRETERCSMWKERADKAEADAAAMRSAILVCRYPNDDCPIHRVDFRACPDTCIVNHALESNAGRDLLAELEAAREVVKAVRHPAIAGIGSLLNDLWEPVREALAKYDAVKKR